VHGREAVMLAASFDKLRMRVSSVSLALSLSKGDKFMLRTGSEREKNTLILSLSKDEKRTACAALDDESIF